MQIHTDSLHRIAYATDASAYRELPMGVAYPENVNDIIELIHQAKHLHTHLIPRAGGTSIAGQVVGSGIVVDISRHFNHILQLDQQHRWVWVEPGVVRDELNLFLKPYGLFFSPETSTSNRCCIGGMVGNNSCGTHSLVYGSTRHHVLEIRGILSDGTPFSTAHPYDNPLLASICSQLKSWAADPVVRKGILDNFPDPSLRRRSCGYAIDESIAPLLADHNAQPNLCALITGSEGTLCFITAVKLSLDPLPPKQQMVLCAHCDSLPKSYQANLVALRHHPVAVELMDGKILDLCRHNHTQDRNRFFIQGEPAALIIAEFNGDDMDIHADAMEHELLDQHLAYHCSRVYGPDINRVWALRKAGLGVLTGVKGDDKPIGVIEDTAVSPQRLPHYLEEFQQLMDQMELSCVYYGHIGTGELHLRPILNIKQQRDRTRFRQVAEATARLVKKHHGSLSGEHGDGRLRGEFIPIMYGDEVYQMMRQLKHCFDPEGIFNIGKIVDAPPMDQCLRYDVEQSYHCADNDLMCSIEQCNGAGDCRKSNAIGGTMCPTFKLTHHELMSTRARANVLREILTRGLPSETSATSSQEAAALKQMLNSCLACKGCRGECPSNVDMTQIRSQVLQMLHRSHGTPFRSWMVARMAMIEQLGHIVYPLYNLFATNQLTAPVIKHIVSFHPQRSIPTLYAKSMRQQVASFTRNNTLRANFPHQQTTKTVYLFADEFTNLHETPLGLTFAQLLIALGYEVIIPRTAESGRAAISKGCLNLAARYANKNVRLLRDIITPQTPLVGIEPSCILTFRDEYPHLVSPDLRSDAEQLGQNCLLYDEFIMREVANGNIHPEQFSTASVEVWLHGHCHQKALVGIEKTAAMLRLLRGCRLHIIPSSCCGMAGSFGYEKEHYRTSLAIGEMTLFPAVRRAMQLHQFNPTTPTLVAAPGTSCRQQILDGTGVHALHPIEIMYRWLTMKQG
ncbi:MAG: FAD-binding protein [Bacteroidales bacterium]|nr:FAD-binding protein [Bacteroidales bacterium]